MRTGDSVLLQCEKNCDRLVHRLLCSTAIAVVGVYILPADSMAQSATASLTQVNRDGTNIRFDGTTRRSLTSGLIDGGNTIEIPEAAGTVANGNLFHSFSDFSIGEDHTARFTGSSRLDNVITRVTGSPSEILGTLRSDISNADFYLINPQGVVFHPGSEVSVPKGFHVRTEPLRFDGGELPLSGAIAFGPLITPRPESFGFVDSRSATIFLNGVKMERGASFEVVAPAVEVNGGGLITVGQGSFDLGDGASGEGATPSSLDSTINAGDIDIDTAKLTIDATGNLDELFTEEGQRTLAPVTLALRQSSAPGIVSSIRQGGNGNSGNIDIDITGDFTTSSISALDNRVGDSGANAFTFKRGRVGTDINSETGGQVGAISIDIAKGDLRTFRGFPFPSFSVTTLSNGSMFSRSAIDESLTSKEVDSGFINITNNGGTIDLTFVDIFAGSAGLAPPSDINVSAFNGNDIRIDTEARIDTSITRPENNNAVGDITFDAFGTLFVNDSNITATTAGETSDEGRGLIRLLGGIGDTGGIKLENATITGSAFGNGGGDASDIRLTSFNEFTIDRTTIVTNADDQARSAGSIVVDSVGFNDNLDINNTTISATVNTVSTVDVDSSIDGTATGRADQEIVAAETSAGSVRVDVNGSMSLFKSEISANTTGSSDAGSVDIAVDKSLSLIGGKISSSATFVNPGDAENPPGDIPQGNAGDITVNAGSLNIQSAFGDSPVNFTPDLFNNSVDNDFGGRIRTNSETAGDAGNININISDGDLVIESFSADLANFSEQTDFDGNKFLEPNKAVTDFITGEDQIIDGQRFELERSASGISSNAEETQSGSAGNIAITLNNGDLIIARQARIATNSRSTEQPDLDQGSITILAPEGSIRLEDFPRGILATTAGDAPGGNVDITAKQLLITGGHDRFQNGNEDNPEGIIVDTQAGSPRIPNGSTGVGGNISLHIDELEMSGGAVISARTRGRGDAGDISIGGLTQEHANLVRLTTTRADTARSTNGSLDNNDQAVRDDPPISTKIAAGVLSSSNGGGSRAEGAVRGQDFARLRVSGDNPPDSGQIEIKAKRIELDHSSINTVFDLQADRDPAEFNALADDSAGNITIDAESIVSFGGDISASSSGPANAGKISITVAGEFALRGTSPEVASVDELRSPRSAGRLENGRLVDGSAVNGIPTATGVRALVSDTNDNLDGEVRTGDAGSIEIIAGGLSLYTDGEFSGQRPGNAANSDVGRANPGNTAISSTTQRSGNAGDVNVVVAGRILLEGDNTEISSNAVTDLIRLTQPGETNTNGAVPHFNNIGDAGNVNIVAGEVLLTGKPLGAKGDIDLGGQDGQSKGNGPAIASNAEAGADAGRINLLVADFTGGQLPNDEHINNFNEFAATFRFDPEIMAKFDPAVRDSVDNPGRIQLRGAAISSRTEVYDIPGTKYQRFFSTIDEVDNDFVVARNPTSTAIDEPGIDSVPIYGLDRFLGTRLYENTPGSDAVFNRGLVPTGNAGEIQISADTLDLRRRDDDLRNKDGNPIRTGPRTRVSAIRTNSGGLGDAGTIDINLTGNRALAPIGVSGEKTSESATLRLGDGQRERDRPLADARNTINSGAGSRAGGQAGTVTINIDKGDLLLGDPSIIAATNSSLGMDQFLDDDEQAALNLTGLADPRDPASRANLSIALDDGNIIMKDAEIQVTTSGVFDGGTLNLRVRGDEQSGNVRLLDGSEIEARSNVGGLVDFDGDDNDQRPPDDRGLGDFDEERIGFSRGIARRLAQPGDAGDIVIDISGDLILDRNATERFETSIQSTAGLAASGAAGSITVNARSLYLNEGSEITSNSLSEKVSGDEKVGNIDITLSNDLVILGAKVAAQSAGTANAGEVDITADKIIIAGRDFRRDDDRLDDEPDDRQDGIFADVKPRDVRAGFTLDSQATTSGVGQRETTVATGGAGGIDVRANSIRIVAGDVLIEDAPPGFDTTSNGVGPTPGLISSEAGPDARNAGNVSVTAVNKLLLETGSAISAATSSTSADLGPKANVTVTVEGTEPVLLDGSFITAETTGSHMAGSVSVDVAGDLRVDNGGQITSSATAASATGAAGSVTVKVGEDLLLNGEGSGDNTLSSQIASAAGPNAAGAGSVTIEVEQTAMLNPGTQITAASNSSTNPSAPRSTVQVAVRGAGSDALTINDATISAKTTGVQDAGNVEVVVTGGITINGGGTNAEDDGGLDDITSSAVGPRATGSAGTVAVSADSIDLSSKARLSSVAGEVSSGAGTVSVESAKTLVVGRDAEITATTTSSMPDENTERGSVSVVSSAMVRVEGGQISAETSGVQAAGDTIVTSRMSDVVVTAGGQITSSASGDAVEGAAGSVIVEALEGAITLDGQDNNGQVSRIASTAAGSSGGAGDVRTDSKRLSLGDGTEITALTSSDQSRSEETGQVIVNVSSDDNDALLLRGASITAETSGAQDAGTVTVTAKDGVATLESGSEITSSANDSATGVAGSVIVDARRLNLNSSDVASTAGAISQGAGSVTVTSREVLNVDSGSSITATTRSGVDRRDGIPESLVTVIADDAINVAGGGRNPGEISAETTGVQPAGSVRVISNTKDVTLSVGGQITSSASGDNVEGRAGNVTVEAQRGRIALSDSNSRIASSAAGSSEGAGSVETVSRRLSLGTGTTITAETSSMAPAVQTGRVDVSVTGNGDGALSLTGATISAETSGAQDAGEVIVDAMDGVASLTGSEITSSATNSADGVAGSVTVDARRLSLDNSDVSSAAGERSEGAGSVTVTTRETLDVASGSRITATTTSGTVRRDGLERSEVMVVVDASINVTGEGEISAETSGIQPAGDVFVSSADGDITLIDGGEITSSAEGSDARGAAGTVTVNAIGGTVRLAGTAPNHPSQISSTADVNALQAGSVNVNAERVEVNHDTRITATTERRLSGNETPDPAVNVLVTASSEIDVNGGEISAETTGTQRAGNVGVVSEMGRIQLRNGGEITSSASGSDVSGAAGAVEVDTALLEIDSLSRIASEAEGRSGGAGAVSVVSDQDLVIGEGATITALTSSLGDATEDPGTVNVVSEGSVTIDGGKVTAATRGTQAAGNVNVVAMDGDVTVRENGLVSSSAERDSERAGTVTVTASRDVMVETAGRIETTTNSTRLVESDNRATITLNAGRNIIVRDGTVTAATSNRQDAGDVRVFSDMDVLVEATGQVEVGENEGIGISSASGGPDEGLEGAAGNVIVTAAGNVRVAGQGASIDSSAGRDSTKAGTVTVNAETASLLSGGSIETVTESTRELVGDPAAITVTISGTDGDVLMIDDGQISAETSGRQSAGDVTVFVARGDLLVTGTAGSDAEITSSAGGERVQGQAGNVEIEIPSGLLRITEGGTISSTAEGASSGAGNVNVLANLLRADGGTITAANKSSVASSALATVEIDVIGGGLQSGSDALDLSGANVTTTSSGRSNAGNTFLLVRSGDARISGGSEVTSEATDDGNAGITLVRVPTGTLRVIGVSAGDGKQTKISSEFGSQKNKVPGAVVLRADKIEVSDNAIVTASTNSEVADGLLPAAPVDNTNLRPGSVVIYSDTSLSITSNAEISSRTLGKQDAGAVSVIAAAGDLLVDDATITSQSTGLFAGAPNAGEDAGNTGDGGDVNVIAIGGSAVLRNATITSDVSVGERTPDGLLTPQSANIFVQAFRENEGDNIRPTAGDIKIFGDTIFIEDNSTVQTSGSAGVAGTIVIGVNPRNDIDSSARNLAPQLIGSNVNLDPQGIVQSVPLQVGGQNILPQSRPTAGDSQFVVIRNSDIISNGSFPAMRGSDESREGGDPIRLSGDFVVVQDVSRISSIVELPNNEGTNLLTVNSLDALPDDFQSLGFNTGDFTIQLNGDEASIVEFGSEIIGAGAVNIVGAETDIGSELQLDEGQFVDIDGLLQAACAARDSEDESSFVIRGNLRGIRTPDQPLSGLAPSKPGETAQLETVLLAVNCSTAEHGQGRS